MFSKFTDFLMYTWHQHKMGETIIELEFDFNDDEFKKIVWDKDQNSIKHFTSKLHKELLKRLEEKDLMVLQEIKLNIQKPKVVSIALDLPKGFTTKKGNADIIPKKTKLLPTHIKSFTLMGSSIYEWNRNNNQLSSEALIKTLTFSNPLMTDLQEKKSPKNS